ncbi:serine/threonine kinase 16 [Xylogone sp. PMI_703]|nr:serine/threonine kinase 16 [Xylogone sp. PMI_703]
MATPEVSLDYNAIPGTMHLVDIEGTLSAKHAKGSNSDIVLIPTPSDDPDDPLNWSKARKLMSTICMTVYILGVGLASSAIYAAIVPISEDTGLSVADINSGTGYMYLAFGWGNLIWQPMALQYGKRPAYLASMLCSIPIMVGQAHVHSNGAWIALKVLQGFVGAPIESLGEISVADVYFSHQRGTYMAVYAAVLYGAGFLGPILGGFINDGQGWKWVQYWTAIWLAVGFIFNFFFMEETNYDRVPLGTTQDSARVVHQDETTSTTSEKDAKDIESQGTHIDSKMAATTTEGSNRPQLRDQKTKSFLQRMSLRDKKRSFTVHIKIWRIFWLLTFPVISYSGFICGCGLIWYNVINATTSLVLSSPPYNFSSSIVGVSYFACILGVILALPFVGFMGDYIIVRMARHRGGIWKAEYRLWLFIGPVFILPFSLLLWGLGAAHKVHWFGLVFSEFLTGLVVTIIAQLSVSYLIDSYKDLSGDAIVSIVLIRNSMSFGIGYAVTPWVTNLGLQNAYLVAAFVGMATMLTAFPMIKYGPILRERSRKRYYKLVGEAMKESSFHY